VWVIDYNKNITIIHVGLNFKSNQIKFNKQQRAKSHLQVAKTLIKTINIFIIIRTEGKRSNLNTELVW